MMIMKTLLPLLFETPPEALQAAKPQEATLPDLFSQGSPFWMSLLTILLVALLFAAWKAPRWVKEIGLAAPVVAILSVLFGLYNTFDTLGRTAGAISPGVLFGGLQCCTIPIIYGLLIYLVSLIIRIIHKPRI